MQQYDNSSCRILITVGYRFLLEFDNRHKYLQSLHGFTIQSSQHSDNKTSVKKPHDMNVLFFESLMNSDMEHNDSEISQGVLHMASELPEHVNIQFAKVKMPIVGQERNVFGLEGLEEIFQETNIHLICITLLEGYWEGVVKLIRKIRSLGSRARIAIGGVMPTLVRTWKEAQWAFLLLVVSTVTSSKLFSTP